MEQPTLRRERLIWQWTTTHEVGKVPGTCEECGEEICWGHYRREVWIDPHPKGDIFIIRIYHEEPSCPAYDDPHWQRQ